MKLRRNESRGHSNRGAEGVGDSRIRRIFPVDLTHGPQSCGPQWHWLQWICLCPVRSLVVRLLGMFLVVGTVGMAHACPAFFLRVPQVSRALCQQAALVPSGATSVLGQPLLVRDVAASPAQWRVLVLGGIHGDEFSSASLVFHWIGMALRDPLDTHWRFLPVLNPDGMLRRPATRVNAHGVDLNRNFATPDWVREAPLYWERRTRKDPRRWPGSAPLSEPESRYLAEQIRTFAPDLVVSVHAPYGVLDFDGPLRPPTRLGRLYLDRVGVFPGSLGHYCGLQQGIPVVTVELPNALRAPPPAEMRRMWGDLQRWMQNTLPRPASKTTGASAPQSAPVSGLH
ncbi:M14 family zinc carboxypeptidase [Candidatus Symbiobacter mobilis]|nr:M14 family zinc carboxypeptidase [Candidatus Symbiobacter mobilis]